MGLEPKQRLDPTAVLPDNLDLAELVQERTRLEIVRPQGGGLDAECAVELLGNQLAARINRNRVGAGVASLCGDAARSACLEGGDPQPPVQIVVHRILRRPGRVRALGPGSADPLTPSAA